MYSTVRIFAAVINRNVLHRVGLIALALTLTETCGAQTLGGFMGFDWHDEIGLDKSIMSQLPGVHYNVSKSNENLLIFDNVEWMGIRTSSVVLVYCPEGLFQAWATFEVKALDAMQLFQRIRKKIVKKYGQSTQSTIRFESPYKAGDGREVEACASGKAKIIIFWKFKDGNHVCLTLTKTGYVFLVFINREMSDQYDQYTLSKRIGQ